MRSEWRVANEGLLFATRYSPTACRFYVDATVPLDDPQSRFGADHQNIATVQQEAERLGIPRVL